MSAEKSPTHPSSGSGGSPAACPTGTCPPKECVTKITAKVPGTKGKRDATKQLPDNVLKDSTSKDESLSANAPAVLVRGCTEVELSAETTPAGKPVKWQVKPNENTESAPALTPTDGGKKAKLKTDKSGSFSVIATLGACKVVWNVVFVWVKVDPATSVINSQNSKYAGTGGGGFESGQFSPGQYPWDAKVKMEVIGGRKDGKLGVGKIKLHILQNGVADTLTGHYDAGGTALEVPRGGLPIRDSNDGSSPFMDIPTKVTPANSGISDSSKNREVWTGDAPAGGFPMTHKHTHKPLRSISGINGFQTAIASVSDDAPNSIVVHAKTAWSADFSGKVDAAGNYTPHGAHTNKEAQFHLISAATGGQDACDAGFETFQPRFNGGTDTKWTP
jgi:hypothetical protein